MVELLEIGVLVALAAWILTQVHLILVARRIKIEIDTNREGTQLFVDQRIAKIETILGQHQAALTAQIPPNPTAEIDGLRTELQEFARSVGEDMAKMRDQALKLPEDVEFRIRQEQGRKAQELMSVVKDRSDELRGELQAAGRGIDPQLIQAGDFRARILKVITREPTKKELKDMGSIGELVWTAGRAKLAEWIQTEDAFAPRPGVRISPASGGGNLEI